MEAATPLRPTRVHALVGRLIVENVVVDDPVAAELVARAIGAGEDPARVVADAIEIGARILDREQAGASVEVLRSDLEKASREVEERLGATSEQVVTELRTRLEEARERLFKQFSSADESNPLASFQKLAVSAIRQSSDQQHAHLREMNGRIAALQVEIAKLQAEREKAIEVAAEHERSTAKGRP